MLHETNQVNDVQAERFDLQTVETFGKENLSSFQQNNDMLIQSAELESEIQAKRDSLKKAFGVDLSLPDILVSAVSGVVMGACGGAFKSYIPKHGSLKHEHSTTRTAVDYKVPKPEGYKGSAQSLHRQIGPGHDLFRFREALDLMSGKTNDFPLWGKTIAEQTGGVLHTGNEPLKHFMSVGGFKIPDDPKKELMNHLLIDFFTKTSLPIPGTSSIADKNQVLAKIMLVMYDNGLNLKNAVGSGASSAILQLIIWGYIFLFKAVPETHLFEEMKNRNRYAIKNCFEYFKQYLKSQEYHMMEMIAHGSSFLLDTFISVTSKNHVGLFELNYLSLLTFTVHTVKYIIEGCRRLKVGKAEIKALSSQLEEYNSEYYKRLEAQFVEIGNSEEIREELFPESADGVSSQLNRLENLKKKQKETMEDLEI